MDILMFLIGGAIAIGCFLAAVTEEPKAVFGIIIGAFIFAWAVAAHKSCPIEKTEIIGYQTVVNERGKEIQVIAIDDKIHNLNNQFKYVIGKNDKIKLTYYKSSNLGVYFAIQEPQFSITETKE